MSRGLQLGILLLKEHGSVGYLLLGGLSGKEALC